MLNSIKRIENGMENRILDEVAKVRSTLGFLEGDNNFSLDGIRDQSNEMKFIIDSLHDKMKEIIIEADNHGSRYFFIQKKL